MFSVLAKVGSVFHGNGRHYPFGMLAALYAPVDELMAHKRPCRIMNDDDIRILSSLLPGSLESIEDGELPCFTWASKEHRFVVIQTLHLFPDKILPFFGDHHPHHIDVVVGCEGIQAIADNRLIIHHNILFRDLSSHSVAYPS